MYGDTGAQFRPELQVKVEQAMAADTKFIADAIFPSYPVKTRTGVYKKIRRGKGQLLSGLGGGAADPLARAPGTAYATVTRTSEQASWITVDRGLMETLDATIAQDESRFYDVESFTATSLMRNIRTYRELRVAAKIFNETIWGTALTPVATYTNNITTLDFAADLRAAKQLVDLRQEDANTLVISRKMWDLAVSSTLLRQYFFGTAGGNAMIDAKMVGEKFGISNVLIGNASNDTTKVNQNSTDANLNWVWNDNYFWVGNVQGGPPEAGGAGRTFILEDLVNGSLFLTESKYEWKKRSTHIRVRQDSEENTVNEVAGVLCKIN